MSKIDVLGYHRPETLSQALTLLKTLDAPTYLVAGGTDFVPRMRRPNASARMVVDLGAIRQQLNQIELREDGLHIGSMVTHTQLCEHPLVQENASVLVQACHTVGSRQIRNRGTLGGNIGNASPAGDSMPALLALDAKVTIRSEDASRTVPLPEILVGPSKIALSKDEIITDFLIPEDRLGNRGWYKKMSNRNALTISLVSAAIAVESDGAVHLAFGSVAPVPIRFAEIERRYLQHQDPEELISDIGAAVTPISDVRASAEYRKEMAMNLVREGLYSMGILVCGAEV